jgi:hypothetical protein
MGDLRAEQFANALAREGACAAAEALGPTSEERERETLAAAIGERNDLPSEADTRRL